MASRALSASMTRTGGGFALPSERSTPRGGASAATTSAAAESGITHPSVLAIFDPERDSKLKVPYAEQGDPAMYTEESRKARDELRRSTAINDAITRLAKLLPWEDGRLTRSAYLELHDKLMTILLPKASTEDRDAIRARDWSVDSVGEDSLSRERFFAAMFELTDNWTTSTDAEEYLAFINALVFRLKRWPSGSAAGSSSHK